MLSRILSSPRLTRLLTEGVLEPPGSQRAAEIIGILAEARIPREMIPEILPQTPEAEAQSPLQPFAEQR